MHLSRYILALGALAFGVIFSLLGARLAVDFIEARSLSDVSRVLELNGQDWTEVNVDGLQVVLGGIAPDETGRFQSLKIAATVIDAARLVDAMSVVDAATIAPPRFSIEILRNDDGISLIGLIPTVSDRNRIIQSIRDTNDGVTVTDLLETADFSEPDGWAPALAYGLSALADLPRSKISIRAGQVGLRAISDSAEEKRRLETLLASNLPQGLRLAINISAPRPVISPYSLRFVIDTDGARFDACSTFTPQGRDRILAAARNAGMLGKATCTIGLGIPSPTWDDAAIIAIDALAQIGGGSVTFRDADVTLIANSTVPRTRFDDIVGALEANLPDAFSLRAVLPEPEVIDDANQAGPPEFTATLSPEGDVRLNGLVPDDRTRIATNSYARAKFGSDTVTSALRLDADLPRGWSTRVLASLQALSQLGSGSIVTQPDVIEIRGLTGNPNSSTEITRILSENLGASEEYRISVTYIEQLDVQADIPTPQECVDQINQVLDVQKIVFTPGSADIDDIARASIDNIAEIVKSCLDVPFEIAGHTDSQGREVMNQELSQARANSVLDALIARRVLTTNLTAVGYGESLPIADNKTEEGREINRRIEFTLLKPLAASPPVETAPHTAPDTAQEPHTDTEATDEQN